MMTRRILPASIGARRRCGRYYGASWRGSVSSNYAFVIGISGSIAAEVLDIAWGPLGYANLYEWTQVTYCSAWTDGFSVTGGSAATVAAIDPPHDALPSGISIVGNATAFSGGTEHRHYSSSQPADSLRLIEFRGKAGPLIIRQNEALLLRTPLSNWWGGEIVITSTLFLMA